MFLVNLLNAETNCLKAPLVTDETAAELEMISLCKEVLVCNELDIKNKGVL